MRIQKYATIVNQYAQKDILNNKTVVIDGQQYFLGLYTKSNLPYEYGCECDKYADYLKQELSVFKHANVRCFIVFKGGDADVSLKLEKRDYLEKPKSSRQKNLSIPVLMKEVHKEVLTDMGFEYTFCEYESKEEIIALARELNCPILSFDIEYSFSGVQYIPSVTVQYIKKTKTLLCSIYTLDDFLRKIKLTKDKLATFIVLTDENIFSENYFKYFFKFFKIPLKPFQDRNTWLLQVLSHKTDQEILQRIVFENRFITKPKFMRLKNKALKYISPKPELGIPSKYLLDKLNFRFENNDPEWFAKGVASGYIARQLINLYRSGFILNSWMRNFIVKFDVEDPLYFSLEIVQYIYQLFTNFENSGFSFLNAHSGEIEVIDKFPISKPAYDGDCLFSSGWNDVQNMKLFEHFLSEKLKGFDINRLSKVTDDAKLLFISLVYFDRKHGGDSKNLTYGVLLSYVLLGIVYEKIGKYSNRKDLIEGDVSLHDCETASVIMEKYMNASDAERNQMDIKTVHPLVQYQYCLQNMDYLNVLCGAPFKPTIYSKTINSTFIYKVLIESDNEVKKFINKKLNSAPTVLHIVNKYFKILDDFNIV